MSSSDSPTLQWPNHREGSKISDPIRFEEMTDVKCPYCGSSNVSLLDAEGKELECNECGNKDVPARFSPDKEEGGEDAELRQEDPDDTNCPDCGQDLAELASEEMDMHILRHHPEYADDWYKQEDPNNVRFTNWEGARRTPGGGFIEVPNKSEGGADYYDAENGDWVAWGVRGLIDEEIVDVLIKGEEGGGGYMGEGSGQGELGGIIKTREEATPYQAGGEDAELGQEDPDDSSTQLNPTTYQNQTSLGQGQSVPTSTVGLSKGEDIESCGVGCCSDIECGCGDCEYCDITLWGR